VTNAFSQSLFRCTYRWLEHLLYPRPIDRIYVAQGTSQFWFSQK